MEKWFRNEERIDQIPAGWWHTNKRGDLGCKLSMNGAFFDRRIEMRPVPRDYANFMINNQCSEEGHIAPITRTGMHYHNLKRWLSITPLIANNRVNCCLSSLSLSLSLALSRTPEASAWYWLSRDFDINSRENILASLVESLMIYRPYF